MDFVFPLLILFMIGLLFVSSRQRKRQEQKQSDLVGSIVADDVVLMGCGISGTVIDVDVEKDTLDLEIAPDVITTWRRSAVREKLVDEGAHDAGDDGSVGALENVDSPSDGAVGGMPTGARAVSIEKSSSEGAGSPGSSRPS